MRVDGASGRTLQPWLQADIEPLNDRVDLPATGAQAIEDAGFALPAMGNEGTHMIVRLGNGGATSTARRLSRAIRPASQ
jgi:hypothetical protein